jgi:hypothetical protein
MGAGNKERKTAPAKLDIYTKMFITSSMTYFNIPEKSCKGKKLGRKEKHNARPSETLAFIKQILLVIPILSQFFEKGNNFFAILKKSC